MKKTIVLLLVALGWAAFILWTIKKLWRSSDEPKEALFWAKVKLGSLAATIGSSLYMPTIGDLPPLSYWAQVAIWAFLLFPASMWAVYLGNRWFHSIVDRH